REGPILMSLGCSALAMIGAFSIIANLSSFVQFNLGYPREALGGLYMVGGVLAFFGMRLAGSSVDRWGSTRVVTIGTVALIAVIARAFFPNQPLIPVLVIFYGYHLDNSLPYKRL